MLEISHFSKSQNGILHVENKPSEEKTWEELQKWMHRSTQNASLPFKSEGIPSEDHRICLIIGIQQWSLIFTQVGLDHPKALNHLMKKWHWRISVAHGLVCILESFGAFCLFYTLWFGGWGRENVIHAKRINKQYGLRWQIMECLPM